MKRLERVGIPAAPAARAPRKRRRHDGFALLGVLLALVAVGALVFGASSLKRAHHAAKTKALPTPLYVEVRGGGGVPVVLVHGLLGSGRYWNDVSPLLEGAHWVIVPDLLGFGRSPWPETAYTVGAHLDGLTATVEAVTAEPVVLVGHSMGAVLAVEYARTRPGAVLALVLVSPPLFLSEADFRRRIRGLSPLTRAFARSPALAFLACTLHEALGSFGGKMARWLNPGRPGHVASDASEHIWESMSGSLRHVVFETSLADSLPRLSGVPVLIIHGSEDGMADGDELCRLASTTGAEILCLSGDHHLPLAAPEGVAEAIESFLARTMAVRPLGPSSLSSDNPSATTPPWRPSRRTGQ